MSLSVQYYASRRRSFQVHAAISAVAPGGEAAFCVRREHRHPRLRDDVGAVNDPGASNPNGPRDVLSSLPSSRPQRRSPKRDGGTRAKSPPGSGGARRKAGARPASSSAARATAGSGAAARRRAAATPSKPIAAQGYQPLADPTPVEPPTSAEILVSAVQAAGEVAQIGLTLGERLLRAAASRLPKP